MMLVLFGPRTWLTIYCIGQLFPSSHTAERFSAVKLVNVISFLFSTYFFQSRNLYITMIYIVHFHSSLHRFEKCVTVCISKIEPIALTGLHFIINGFSLAIRVTGLVCPLHF